MQTEKGEKMTHKIKILEPYADAIVEGRKNFEVRFNDRGYNAGDFVEFTVINNDGIPFLTHPLNNKTYRITYVFSGMGIKDEWVVFGMREER